jgi:predicted lipoprotein with Yx(FWY)xxD motif
MHLHVSHTLLTRVLVISQTNDSKRRAISAAVSRARGSDEVRNASLAVRLDQGTSARSPQLRGMRRRIAGATGLLALISLAACGSNTCAGVGAPDFVVTVVDSLTGAAAAAGATFLMYDVNAGGVRVDSLVGRTDTDIIMSRDYGAGRFRVVVRKDGYRDWTKTDVEVRGGCTTERVELTARLIRP